MVGETYELGLGTGVRPGKTVPRIFSAIKWGAPIVEVDTPDWSQIGVQAIKELSKVNKVDITYHFSPMDPRHEFALPDSYLIKATEGKATPESRARNAQMNIDWAKQIGAKVATVHPTSMIPRSHGRTVVFYDNVNDSVIASQVPEHIWQKHQRGELSMEEARKQCLEQMRTEYAGKIPAQMGQIDYQIDMYDNAAQRCRQQMEAIKLGMGEGRFKEVAAKLGVEGTPEALKKHLKSLENQSAAYEYEKKHAYEQKKLIQETYARFLPPELRLEEYKWTGKEPGKEKLVLDQEATTHKLADNFVRNFLPVAEEAIKSGIKLGVENMDSRFYFSSPEEVNILMDKLKGALKNKGYSDSEIKEHIGITFDYGHANTMANFEIKRKVKVFNPNTGKMEERTVNVPYGAKDIKTPLDVAKKLGAPIIHSHYHENYGDWDAHMPAGTSVKAGEDRAKKIKEMQDFFKKRGESPRIIHEGGVHMPEQLDPIAYQIAFRSTTPGYSTVSGMPATAAAGFGPSQFASLPFDPIIEKGKEGESFFYPSWLGDLF